MNQTRAVDASVQAISPGLNTATLPSGLVTTRLPAESSKFLNPPAAGEDDELTIIISHIDHRGGVEGGGEADPSGPPIVIKGVSKGLLCQTPLSCLLTDGRLPESVINVETAD